MKPQRPFSYLDRHVFAAYQLPRVPGRPSTSKAQRMAINNDQLLRFNNRCAATCRSLLSLLVGIIHPIFLPSLPFGQLSGKSRNLGDSLLVSARSRVRKLLVAIVVVVAADAVRVVLTSGPRHWRIRHLFVICGMQRHNGI